MWNNLTTFASDTARPGVFVFSQSYIIQISSSDLSSTDCQTALLL